MVLPRNSKARAQRQADGAAKAAEAAIREEAARAAQAAESAKTSETKKFKTDAQRHQERLDKADKSYDRTAKSRVEGNKVVYDDPKVIKPEKVQTQKPDNHQVPSKYFDPQTRVKDFEDKLSTKKKFDDGLSL